MIHLRMMSTMNILVVVVLLLLLLLLLFIWHRNYSNNSHVVTSLISIQVLTLSKQARTPATYKGKAAVALPLLKAPSPATSAHTQRTHILNSLQFLNTQMHLPFWPVFMTSSKKGFI